ncbi:MAG TPA: glycosyltransferase family 39 protein [Clostridia bacterium]|nr:glycosyltransferase family 39 protein [Clostridia bacterium]
MKKTVLDSEKRFVLLLVLASFVLYLSWSLITPFGQAPDEVLRFDIVDFIYKYRQLPVAGDPRLLYGGYGATYAAMPFLSYMVSAFFCIFAKAIGIHLPAYIISRQVSVLSGVITVFFTYKIGAKLFRKSFARYFLPVFLAFLPQFSFANSYTNQDSFMMMLSAVTVYLWIRGIETQWDLKTVVLTGVVSGLMLLTYLNGYVLVVATLLIVLLTHPQKRSPEFFKKLLLCIGILLLISGWFFIRNAYYYHGDIFGLSTTTKISETKAAMGYKPSELISKLSIRHGLGGLLVFTNWPSTSFVSFWADFGNMEITLNPYYYLAIFALMLISFIGLSYRFLQKKREGIASLFSNKLAITFLFVIFGAFALHVYYSLNCDFQPQGRYLFPAIIPIVILMTKGFEQFFSQKRIRLFYKVVAASFILLDFYTLYLILFQRYFVL